MTESKVYFSGLRATKEEEGALKRIERLFEVAGFASAIKPGDLVALKLHFGEPGNIGFLRPIYVRPVVEMVKKAGGKPFLTDANTLYVRKRHNAVEHLETALRHGFLPPVVDAPIVIADGLVGKDFVEVEVNGKHLKKVKVSSAAYHADTIIGVAHFKGHLESGFGGALKNIGMGLGPRSGKQMMHSAMKPKIDKKKCKGCGRCLKWCPGSAIALVEKFAMIDQSKCVGCGECVVTCRNSAIQINWESAPTEMQERMVEFACGILREKQKGDKVGFFNYLIGITPDCDCLPWSDYPVVSDIGILASKDPVAIDQASVDLVNEQLGHRNSVLKKAFEPGQDKFKDVRNIAWEPQLKHAEEMGLGKRAYSLIEV